MTASQSPLSLSGVQCSTLFLFFLEAYRCYHMPYFKHPCFQNTSTSHVSSPDFVVKGVALVCQLSIHAFVHPGDVFLIMAVISHFWNVFVKPHIICFSKLFLNWTFFASLLMTYHSSPPNALNVYNVHVFLMCIYCLVSSVKLLVNQARTTWCSGCMFSVSSLGKQQEKE